MFGLACIAAMKAHAVASFPRESVGIVVDGDYHPITNESNAPDAVEFDERVAWRHGDALQALVHSHPSPAMPCPSYRDQQSQLAWAIPWGIVMCNEQQAREPFWWGDGTPRPPYLPDPLWPVGFRWVVDDCYQKIRDAYWQGRGIRLPDFPRAWGAWKPREGEPPFSGYVEHYKAGGFVRVDRPKPWDLAVMKFGTHAAPSHAGVLLPGNTILHHLGADEPYSPERPAIREPIGRWLRCIENGGFWLRYEGALAG